ncbi:DNA-3'-diphospho-5'-guanosine diphosphatase [Aureococcus anophagefferens]|nr:DNA-3'-diphospho-5'-guanosine diphosphatase [Aureococcus anophagefferens]
MAVRMPGGGAAESKASSPVHAARNSNVTDRSDELLEDALRVNGQTEEIGNATLDQLRRQGEQRARRHRRPRRLQGTATTLEDTIEPGRGQGVLHDIGCKIIRSWLVLIIVMLTTIDGLMAYRLATNDGRLGKKKSDGKSTLAAALAARGWTVVNQDRLGNRKRCERAAAAALAAGGRVVVDRCNHDAAQRGHWLRLLAAGGGGGAYAVWLDAPEDLCVARVLGRVGHRTLPPTPKSAKVARGFRNSFVAPRATPRAWPPCSASTPPTSTAPSAASRASRPRSTSRSWDSRHRRIRRTPWSPRRRRSGGLHGSPRLRRRRGGVRRGPAAAAKPKLVGTRSGILYYDGFDAAGAPPRRDGERVTIAFTVRRNGFDSGDVLETGTGSFAVGDNSANDAVDELVRSMGAGNVRRATVPASFRFDPDRPSAPTYLELEVLVPRTRPRGEDCGANATSVVLRPWIAQ